MYTYILHVTRARKPSWPEKQKVLMHNITTSRHLLDIHHTRHAHANVTLLLLLLAQTLQAYLLYPQWLSQWHHQLQWRYIHNITHTHRHKKKQNNVKAYVNYWELKIMSGRDAWKFLKSGILNISTNNEINLNCFSNTACANTWDQAVVAVYSTCSYYTCTCRSLVKLQPQVQGSLKGYWYQLLVPPQYICTHE